ncbi:hypothetical protein GF420_15830 [candidate division GN15 bacterium]|nr:hypothetical protein [candidate division GN15 bacterium]
MTKTTQNITVTNATLTAMFGEEVAATIREAGEWHTPFGSLTRLRGAVWTVEGTSPVTRDCLVKWLKAGEPLDPAKFRMSNTYRGYTITVAPVTLAFDGWVAGAAPISGEGGKQGRKAWGKSWPTAAHRVKGLIDRHLDSGDRGQGRRKKATG